MAHVAVVRRSMRPEEWTDLRFVWLQRGIVADQEEVKELTIRDARQIGESAYEYTDGDSRPLKKGDLYFTPDGTAFIRGRAVIPERFRGQNVYLSLKTAAEMIVKRSTRGIDLGLFNVDIYCIVNWFVKINRLYHTIYSFRLHIYIPIKSYQG